MAIQALPASTVRLLGSSVTITTPQDLIKELIDNAIDARATSIEIAVSPNTIDKIQVRDNGHGIPLGDLDNLGRKAHTSKLRTFDELRAKGGLTLGFRGEALASANSLAASVVVTTRTAGEPVASRVQLRFGTGGVEGRRPLSAPVGTTVHAARLFDRLPVRKQQAMKRATASLGRIRELLHAYVLARPHLKVSFKVVGEPKRSWQYTPGETPSVRDAVLQVLGRELANSCASVSHTVTSVAGNSNSDEGEGTSTFTIRAFLPRPDCTVAAVKGQGAFISVDARPLTTTRGAAKKLAALLKSNLTAALSVNGSDRGITNPFCRVDICCTPTLYDANVAPLKDEVLFGNESELLEAFKNLCEKAYRSTSCHGDAGSITKNVSGSVQQAVFAQPAPDGRDVFVGHEPGDKDAPGCSAVHSVSELPEAQALPIDRIHETPADDTPNRNIQSHRTVQLRTAMNVNLARNKSDVTDEMCTGELITAQLPAEPIVSISAPRVTLPPGRRVLSEAMRGSHSIERYFRPEQSPEIEIATDDTATMGPELPPGRDSPVERLEQRHGGRRPLQPLSEAALNRLNDESRSSPSPSFTTSPERSLVEDIPTSATRPRDETSLMYDFAMMRDGAQDIGYQPAYMEPSPAQARGGGMVSSSSSPVPTRGALEYVFQTPPSSDQRLSVRASLAPFRPPLLSATSGSRRRQPRNDLNRNRPRIGEPGARTGQQPLGHQSRDNHGHSEDYHAPGFDESQSPVTDTNISCQGDPIGRGGPEGWDLEEC